MRFSTCLLSVVLAVNSVYVAASNNLDNIRFGHSQDRTRVVFDFTDHPEYEYETLNAPPRLVFSFPSANTDLIAANYTTQSNYLDNLEFLSADDEGMQVILNLPAEMESHVFALGPNKGYGHRVVVDLHEPENTMADSAETPAVNTTKNEDVNAQSSNAGLTDEQVLSSTSATTLTPSSAATIQSATSYSDSGHSSAQGDYSNDTFEESSYEEESIFDSLTTEFSGSAALEQRYFWQDPLLPDQPSGQASFFVEPELYVEWNDGLDSLLFKPYFRFDEHDSERTHADIRELIWLHVGDDWELRTGIGKVFWGQTEALHLVDVINQTDFVEAIDGEDKLGQPMINLQWIQDWGTTSFFVLPYFRERTFTSMDGRLSLPLRVDDDNPIYESSDEEHHIDYAIRYSHSIDIWEVGLSYFDGTAREPSLVPLFDGQELVLRPFYPQMQQFGVDLLAVLDSWLIKFEGIHRDTEQEDFYAFTGGFEYTFVGVFESVFDIGWLMEYQYDERDELAPVPSQNDLMSGARIVFNDVNGTEILFGYVQDLDNSDTRSAFVEASSRINDNWKWRVDAWLFSSDTPSDTTYLLRTEDYVQLSLEYYF